MTICTFTVLVKDHAVRVKRASLFPFPIKFSVELNRTVVTILPAVEDRPNVQRRYRKQIKLDATRALK